MKYDGFPGELRRAIEQRVDIETIRSLVGKPVNLELVGDFIDEATILDNYKAPKLRLVG